MTGHSTPAVWPPHRPVNALPQLPARPLDHVPAWAEPSYRPPGELSLPAILAIVIVASLVAVLAVIGAVTVLHGQWSGWAA